MTLTRWIWVILGGLYAGFFSWYTSFGGPLSDEEIAHHIARVQSAEPPPTPETVALLRKFMEEDTGDDLVMLNLLHLYETPLATEGVAPGETSEEVLMKYQSHLVPELFSRASHPVMIGEAAGAAMDLMNAPGMEHWSRAVGMRYRSRRDLVEITSNPDFAGKHEFKVASMQKTFAFPIDPWFQLGDPRLVLGSFLGLIGCALSWREAAR